jgi:uncharacterized membrane protein
MKKTTLLTLTALVAIVCTLTIACKKSSGGTPTPPPTGKKYFGDVRQIITTSCQTASCHGSATPSGGISFSSDATIAAKYVDINRRAVTAKTMPPAGALPTADQTTIKNWFDAGGRITD